MRRGHLSRQFKSISRSVGPIGMVRVPASVFVASKVAPLFSWTRRTWISLRSIRRKFPPSYAYLCAKLGRDLSEEDAFAIIEESPDDPSGGRGLAIWAIGQLGMTAVLDRIQTDNLKFFRSCPGQWCSSSVAKPTAARSSLARIRPEHCAVAVWRSGSFSAGACATIHENRDELR